ncbi:MAG: hypothetical protein ACT4ON_09810 [Bacteroidota bacterium]
METKKIVIGTLVAGTAMFLLGWLIYGIALADMMHESCNSCMARPMEEMIWWALIISNYVWGLLLTLILNWSGSLTVNSGAKVGAIVGLLAGLGFDLSMYSMTTMFGNFTMIAVDCLAWAIMFGATGLLTALVMSKIKA